MAGVAVATVDPRYTSQKCSRCGHREKANRQSRGDFRCKQCGFSLHADLNAARNIAATTWPASLYVGLAGRRQVAIAEGCAASARPSPRLLAARS